MVADSFRQSAKSSPAWMIHSESIQTYGMSIRRATSRASWNILRSIVIGWPCSSSRAEIFSVVSLRKSPWPHRWLRVIYPRPGLNELESERTILNMSSESTSTKRVGYQSLLVMAKQVCCSEHSRSHPSTVAQVSFEPVLEGRRSTSPTSLNSIPDQQKSAPSRQGHYSCTLLGKDQWRL